MKRRRTPVQSELFTHTPSATLPLLSTPIRIEAVRLLETLLREIVRAEIPYPVSEEAGDEQDQR